MMSHQTPEHFAQRVRTLRGDRSIRQLGNEANVPHSLINAIEKSKGTAGPRIAQKLADAFKLSGRKREDFMKLAESTSMKRRVTPQRALPRHTDTALMDVVISLTGKRPQDIQEISISTNQSYDLIVHNKNGSVTGIELKTRVIYIYEAKSLDELPNPSKIDERTGVLGQEPKIFRFVS